MRYMKRFYDSPDWVEVTKEKALEALFSTWNDNEVTRSMLTIGNLITCRFSEIRVYDDEGLTAMPGLENLLPDEMYRKWGETL